jgi:hypothetical protein
LIPAIPITVVALVYGIGAIRGWYVVREILPGGKLARERAM